MSFPSTTYTTTAAKEQDERVSGWRLLLALAFMLLLGGAAGFVTWGIVRAVAPVLDLHGGLCRPAGR